MGTSVKLAMIVARAKNGVIGREGDLPWRLRDDLKAFKATTKGHPVLMGRKTWESLPRKPLPGRDNLVVSRNGAFQADEARVYTDLEAAVEAAKALAAAAGQEEAFILGGEAIYKALLEKTDRLYVTEVDTVIEGDASFPDFDEAAFQETRAEAYESNDGNEFAFQIRVLDRI